MFATLVVAATAQGAVDEKVLVCHGTASATNSYVLIEVSRSALNGHFDVQDGMLVATGHGKQSSPDQVSLLDGSTFTGDCRDLYIAAYGGSGPE